MCCALVKGTKDASSAGAGEGIVADLSWLTCCDLCMQDF